MALVVGFAIAANFIGGKSAREIADLRISAEMVLGTAKIGSAEAHGTVPEEVLVLAAGHGTTRNGANQWSKIVIFQSY